MLSLIPYVQSRWVISARRLHSDSNLQRSVAGGRWLRSMLHPQLPTLQHACSSRENTAKQFAWTKGGGGGVLPYVWILGMCRARDPFFQPWISFPEHIIFTDYPKICSGASPFYIFWRILPFRRPSFSKFLSFQPVHRLRQRRGLAAVLEILIFTLKTDQAHSGDPHFQAQNGSSSFRNPTFSCSTGSSFRSPCQFFTLPRHIPTKIWVSTPPSPPWEPRARCRLSRQKWLWTSTAFFWSINSKSKKIGWLMCFLL